MTDPKSKSEMRPCPKCQRPMDRWVSNPNHYCCPYESCTQGTWIDEPECSQCDQLRAALDRAQGALMGILKRIEVDYPDLVKEALEASRVE